MVPIDKFPTIILFCSILNASVCLTFSGKNRDTGKPTCFGDICLRAGYSPDVSPPTERNSLIAVNMLFNIDNILSVDHDHNIIGATISLRQTWVDNRIFPRKKSLLENDGWLSAPSRMGRNPETGIPQHIWMPKLYIYGLLKMEIKTNFEQQTSIWIQKKDKNIYVNYDSMIDLYLKCPMVYQYYPFDVHECSVKFSSSDFNSTRLRFHMAKPANWTQRTRIPIGEFDAKINQLENFEFMDTWEEEEWSICGFKIELKRRHWKYIFNYYLTSGLFVVISWVSFLVPTKDVNAKMGLLVTVLLVLVTCYTSVVETSPKAREEQTALSLWMFTMLLFVFLAFVCHCGVMLWRKSKEKQRDVYLKRRKKSLMPAISFGMINVEEGSSTLEDLANPSCFSKVCRRIKSGLSSQDSHTFDFLILIALILMFVTFTTVYTTHYINTLF